MFLCFNIEYIYMFNLCFLVLHVSFSNGLPCLFVLLLIWRLFNLMWVQLLLLSYGFHMHGISHSTLSCWVYAWPNKLCLLYICFTFHRSPLLLIFSFFPCLGMTLLFFFLLEKGAQCLIFSLSSFFWYVNFRGQLVLWLLP